MSMGIEYYSWNFNEFVFYVHIYIKVLWLRTVKLIDNESRNTPP